jgi:hypothetical protein
MGLYIFLSLLYGIVIRLSTQRLMQETRGGYSRFFAPSRNPLTVTSLSKWGTFEGGSP